MSGIKPRYRPGDRFRFKRWTAGLHDKVGEVLQVRKDKVLVVHFDEDPADQTRTIFPEDTERE